MKALRPKRLRFETLESKVLLAADLHAMVVEGDLVVIGSKGDDDLIMATSSDSAGTWTITPASDDSINGNAPGQPVVLSGIVDDVWVALRDGNDKLTIKGAQSGGVVPGSLSVRGSYGSNQILVQDLSVGNDLSIRTRGAADEITVKATDASDELVIRSAAGTDSIECSDVAVGTSLDVHTGGGWYDDTVSIVDTVIGNDLSCRSTRGDNEVIVGTTNVGSCTRVRLGDGTDHVQIGYRSPASAFEGPSLSAEASIASVHTQHLQIQTGGGEDGVDMYDTAVARHLRAYLGDDADQMRILESTIGGNSIVHGGSGDDTLEAGASYGGQLYSGGHDDGAIYFCSPWPFTGETVFDGGEGDDTLRYEQDAEVDQDDRYWQNWEQVYDDRFPESSAPSNPLAADSAADAVNAFAADFYHELAGSGENLAFSPLSLSAALAMVYAGAEEETAAQMAEVLHFPESSDAFHAEYGELLRNLNEADALEGLDLNIANAFWKQFDFPFSQEYLELIQENYDSGENDADFVPVDAREAARQEINQWVEEQTEDKIQDLIPPGVLTQETVLVLANAIYFDAKWAHEFDTYLTRSESFHVSDEEEILVETMHDTGYYEYMEQDGVQYLEVPYEDGRFSMILALPEEGTPLSQIDVTAMTEDLDGFFSELERQNVAMSLPKFEITSTPNAKQALQDLGMEDLFDQHISDLDGMKDPDADLPGRLFVQDVRHKAFIELDEAGTTAAAATAVLVGYTTGMPQDIVQFKADHPFQYFICDTQTDTILFMGHISRPTESA